MMVYLQQVYDWVDVRLVQVLSERQGQGLVEYALILLLVAMVVVAVLPGVAVPLDQVFTQVTGML